MQALPPQFSLWLTRDPQHCRSVPNPLFQNCSVAHVILVQDLPATTGLHNKTVERLLFQSIISNWFMNKDREIIVIIISISIMMMMRIIIIIIIIIIYHLFIYLFSLNVDSREEILGGWVIIRGDSVRESYIRWYLRHDNRYGFQALHVSQSDYPPVVSQLPLPLEFLKMRDFNFSPLIPGGICHLNTHFWLVRIGLTPKRPCNKHRYTLVTKLFFINFLASSAYSELILTHVLVLVQFSNHSMRIKKNLHIFSRYKFRIFQHIWTVLLNFSEQVWNVLS